MAQPLTSITSSRFPTIIRFRSLVIFACTLLVILAASFFLLEFKTQNYQLQLQQLFRNNHYFEKPCYASTKSATALSQDEAWQHEFQEQWQFEANRDGDNYALKEDQCLAAFPKLFTEIDNSVKLRKEMNNPITFDEINSRKTLGQGMGRAMIFKGELYIIEYGDMTYTATRAKSTLNSLYRALVSLPNGESLPSIEFHFSADDFVWDNLKLEGGPVWAYSKRDTTDVDQDDVDDTNIWLMPDFGYWAWPEVNIGPYREARRRIAAVDAEFDSFQSKKKQLAWRGTLNTGHELRKRLIEATKNKYWASVRAIDWGSPQSVADDVLNIEDHCRYMFLAHTEGRSFSGRGKYLLNCRSVFVSHALIWREAHHAALVPSGPEANYVQVQRDFSDLEQKMKFLLDHPDVAERIANNSVTTFRDRYLTPAAESCYWRYLIRKWAEVCDFEPRLYDEKTKKLRGQPYEEWLLAVGNPSH